MVTSWDDDDDFLLDDEEEQAQVDTPIIAPWAMLVVDDEVGVHDVTKLALKRFSYQGRGLEFISAFSAKEAIEILKARDDIALILLDVVMETDHAGLDCARQIRDDLGNENVRIVLRTGQPGQAPEQDVILAYDINDYRAKTELTAERLFSTVVSALRSYTDITALEEYREDAYGLLAQNNQTIQHLIDLSETALFQLGRDDHIQRCNLAFAKLMGKEMKELVGFPLRKVAPEVLSNACIGEGQTSISMNGRSYLLKTQQSDLNRCCRLVVESN
ncbi:hypothetical protein MTBPR1_100194 [Candidatus Terasakiella magnetica]|uniref:Response regulatory domain-containing protein n=1 Tax=Candidatus Terasakiella magnetica TaxID=1867952 RepID=A0A1C3RE39_9PROT|nr:response regulator [Candidatus Terasakiella magnetica]SCA55553.1 hypothetical protein MTBPR1_100194 [Candidatus Terasakiella magnetica]